MSEVKLHLGCGAKYLPGYIHIDLQKMEHIDYVTSIDNLYMFPNNSVHEIYACHCLEHFSRHRTLDVLREWIRVLIVGEGSLRLAVPDFEAIVNEYIQNKDLVSLIGLLHGGQNYENNTHFMSFDFDTLMELMQNAGFGRISKYNTNEFLPHEFDDFSRAYLPHMDAEKGRLMSLNVVGWKSDERRREDTTF